MPVLSSLRHNPKLRFRFLVFVVLIVPLYVVPCSIRMVLAAPLARIFGVVLSDAAGSLVVGFMTNNYVFGLCLYLGATAVELLFMYLGHSYSTVTRVGDLLPALAAIYYAQQLYINMGD